MSALKNYSNEKLIVWVTYSTLISKKKYSVCHRCLFIVPDKTESIYDIFYLTVLYWVSKQFVPDFEKKLVGLTVSVYCATQIYVHWISVIIA